MKQELEFNQQGEILVSEGDKKVVIGALEEISRPLSRYGIDPESLDQAVSQIKLTSNIEEIANQTAKIDLLDKGYEAYVKSIDTQSDQGIFDASVVATSKIDALREQLSDNDQKSALKSLRDGIVEAASQIISTSTNSKKGLIIASNIALAFKLAGCAPAPTLPIPTTEVPAITATATEIAKEYKGQIKEVGQSAIADYWKKASESKLLEKQISKGLSKYDLTGFSMDFNNGGETKTVNFIYFTDPITNEDRMSTQNTEGNWTELTQVTGETNGAGIWTTNFPGKNPETVVEYGYEAGNSDNIVVRFHEIFSIYGDLLPGNNPEDTISIKLKSKESSTLKVSLDKLKVVNEMDLKIKYTQELNRTYKNVDIHSKIEIDESVNKFKEIHIPEEAYAHFVADLVYRIWRQKGEVRQTGSSSEDEFNEFMKLWAKAQETNDPEDWKKVQITIFANDLEDGKGYVQKEYTFWPGYRGTPPDGVIAVDTLSFDFVNATKNGNTTNFNGDAGDYYGVNFTNQELKFYIGSDVWSYGDLKTSIAGFLGIASQYVINNTGKDGLIRIGSDYTPSKILLNGGISVK